MVSSRINRAFIFVLILFVCFYHIPISIASERKCAILLHGLGRTHHSMSSLASTLKKHDYWVVNQDYPSTKKSVHAIAEQYIQPMVDECTKNQAKHIIFITHSLGGIVLQKYLEDHEVKKLTHIVMLSPPNHGSPIVDKFQRYWLFRTLLGPATQSLSTTAKGYTLPTNRGYRVGIIAGNANLTLVPKYFFNEPNDGKVSVSSAYMQGTDDFIVLPVNHTFMMNNVLVQNNILNFLYHQTFHSDVSKPTPTKTNKIYYPFSKIYQLPRINAAKRSVPTQCVSVRIQTVHNVGA